MTAIKIKARSLIRLDAGNDRNGNPRRVFVALGDQGEIVGAWNEGYHGTDAVPEELRPMARLAPTFRTTPGEYRALVRRG